MRLRKQFAVLTLAAALSPLIVYLALFANQLAPKDSRPSLRGLAQGLGDLYERTSSLPADEVELLLSELSVPSRRFLVLSPRMEVLYSGLSGAGQEREVVESFSAIYARFRHQGMRASLQVIPIAKSLKSESPLLVIDPEPWYARVDLRARLALFFSVLAGLLLVVIGVSSIRIMRGLRRDILSLVEGTERISRGDLSYEISVDGRDEFRDLARTIDGMRRALGDMMRRQSLLFMGMSHDLKTPVSLISGYADALAEGMDGEGRDRERYLEIIRSKARRLEEIIDEFISLARLESETRIAALGESEEVDLSQALKALARRFSEEAGLMGRRFRYEEGEAGGAGSAVPLEPLAEEGAGGPRLSMRLSLFERLMENLYSNAVRFSPAGGEIVLRLSAAAESVWMVELLDEGPGIPAEDLPYVFDPFYRGSRSREDGGLGLGLAFAKTIAELHGWELSLGARPDGRTGAAARLLVRNKQAGASS